MTCVKIGKIDTSQVDKCWPAVEQHLVYYAKDWLEKHEDLENIHLRLKQGTLDLWAMAESGNDGDLFAIGICEWNKSPKRSTYFINWCGGEKVKEFLSGGLEMCERYACMHGADEIRLEGRKGWQRALVPHGYTPVVQMKKEVKVLWRS